MKRIIDVAIAATLLLLTLPVLLVVIAGSAVSLRCSPFFTQRRVGLDGATFRFLKVRTLPPETPVYTDKYSLDGATIPPFCQFVRRFHLDELPQLLLVLTGRMTLVGPRPELPPMHAAMDPGFAARRTSIRPGCTGLWQVSVARQRLIHESPEFDEYYVANRSLRLDLWILLMTALQMIPLGRQRHIGFDDFPSWAPRRRAGELLLEA